MEKTKKVKLIGVIASLFLLLIVFSAAFAYFGSFNVDLNTDVAVNINAASPGNASFISSATQLNLQVPAANMSQTNVRGDEPAGFNTAVLTVNLTGAADLFTTCTYDIVYEYDSNSYVYGYGETPVTDENIRADISLAIANGTSMDDFESSTNGTNYYTVDLFRGFNYFEGTNPTEEYDENDKWDSIRKRVLVRNASISSTGELTSQNWLVIMAYWNLPISQEKLAGKAFTGKIYVENYDCRIGEAPGYYTILANNGGKDAIEAKAEPDFSKAATTEDSGMYAAEDDYGMSYYFRGVVDNNWVKFGNYTQDYIIYRGYLSTDNTTDYRDYDTMTDCTSAAAYNKNCEEVKLASEGDDIYWRIVRINGDGSIRMIYSGVTVPTQSAKNVLTNDTLIGATAWDINGGGIGYDNISKYDASTIKTYIDKWFVSTNLTKLNLADRLFCNDISYSVSVGNRVFSAYKRIIQDNNPTLKCPAEDDKYTVSTATGNGLLSYPIGLITADELLYAGASNTDSSINDNLYINSNSSYFNGTLMLYSSSAGAFVYSFYDKNYISMASSYSVKGVRPVINIANNIILSGDGTWNNPYKIG